MINIPLLMAAPPVDAPEGGEIISFLPFIVLCVIIFFIVRHTKRKKEQKNNLRIPTKQHWEENSVNDNKIIIPNICPHCKNPNTKKLSECEWCGNKVC